MSLFMTRRKKEQIGDEIDDFMMRQYHHRCKLEEAKENKNKELFEKEKEKIIEYEKQIQKLRRKLG